MFPQQVLPLSHQFMRPLKEALGLHEGTAGTLLWRTCVVPEAGEIVSTHCKCDLIFLTGLLLFTSAVSGIRVDSAWDLSQNDVSRLFASDLFDLKVKLKESC